MEIRAATPVDLEGMAGLARRAGFSAYARDALAASLGRPAVVALVGAEARRPDGFALFERVLDEAELHLIVVADAARGQGLGRRLLETGHLRLARAGVRAVFLEVAEDNAPARALYAAAGYAPVGRRRGYYASGADALVLRTTLAGSPPDT